MHRALIALAALCLAACAGQQAPPVVSVVSTPPVQTAMLGNFLAGLPGSAAVATCTTNGSDGYAGRPAGVSPQKPTLLAGYTAPPTWCVAGVNYGVGPPAATSFTSWTVFLAANGFPGVYDAATTLTSTAAQGATTVALANVGNIADGWTVVIALDSGACRTAYGENYYWARAVGAPSGLNVTLAAAMPCQATSGAVVNDYRSTTGLPVSLTNTEASWTGIDFSTHCGAVISYVSQANGSVTNSKFGGQCAQEATYLISADSGSPGLTVTNNIIDGGALVTTQPVTISIASPAVITLANHGLLAGQWITLWFPSGTGALPTGLSASTPSFGPTYPYCIIPAGLTTNTFEVSATCAGSAINTTGTQSGTPYIASGGGGAAMVAADGGGTVTVEYNWLLHYDSEVLQVAGPSSGSDIVLNYKFNLIDNANITPGAHMNWLQWGGGVADSPVIGYNTSFQNTLGGAEGYQIGPDQNILVVFNSPSVINNVEIALENGGTNTMSNINHGSNPGSAYSTLTGTAIIENNYIDPSGALNPYYAGFPPSSFSSGGGNAAWAFSGNVNMNTGATCGTVSC